LARSRRCQLLLDIRELSGGLVTDGRAPGDRIMPTSFGNGRDRFVQVGYRDRHTGAVHDGI
jgi:hypothetical protein